MSPLKTESLFKNTAKNIFFALFAVLVTITISPVFAENYDIEIMPGSYQIGCQIDDKCVNPSTITIVEGDSITWLNYDIVSHQIVTIESENDERVAGNFDTGEITAGEQSSFTFRLNGVYNYHDPEYSHITGTIIVKTGNSQPDFDWTLKSIFFSDIKGENTIPLLLKPLYITNEVTNIGKSDPPETNFGLTIYKGSEMVFQEFENLQIKSEQSSHLTYVWTPKESGKYTMIFTADASDYTLETITQNNIEYREIFVYNDIPGPIIQHEHGIEYDKITCKQGLELVTKKTNNSPICASPDTVIKLLERKFLSDK
ncbi:CARDB domain-containing protein [Nitrosopumilus sp. S6]